MTMITTDYIPEVQDRIEHLIKSLGKNNNRFANDLGVDNTVISYIVKGSKYNGGKRNKPSFDLLTKMADTYPHVCLEWLILGTGPMFRDGTSIPLEGLEVQAVKSLSMLEIELQLYRKRELQLLERETQLLDRETKLMNRESQLLDTISNLSKH